MRIGDDNRLGDFQRALVAVTFLKSSSTAAVTATCQGLYCRATSQSMYLRGGCVFGRLAAFCFQSDW